ncbi:GvpL/GvpF family gas vesicle protein [Streptomyces sp. NBC_01431]|uniref:GvpL/GvpF family gas vesicle protein n=1 Tax=Streptomyces sp. NBC_01431 TaxID=2903863 RepID=UPI002E34D002|nr:GvpL/GvpF family gas vesicle protein [Streptomyces sp. NBC_01431]
MNTGQDTLTYVYAIARQTEPLRELLAGLQGVGRAPVVLLAALALLVSPVPQQDFNETALKDHFEDLEWLEEVARAHHEVVQAVAARETVLPLRMATVYQDDGRARRALTEQQPAFARRLAELDGHTEYGVKVYLDPSAPPAATPPGDASLSGPTTPGKAYLQRRKAQHHARETVYQQAQQAAQAVAAIAANYTPHRVRHAPQSGALAGPREDRRENVLNDAYLVPDGDAPRFRTDIEQAAREFPDIRIEVTGPWAPYSFAMTPDQAADPAGSVGQGP